MWKIIYIGNDLQETVIKQYENICTAIDVLNRFARMNHLTFKSDDSLFGGYFVDYSHIDYMGTCYLIK